MKNLNVLRLNGGNAEKVLLRSKCQSDKEACHRVCNRYTASLNNAKRKYYSELIDQCSGDSRKLFKVVSSLCNTPQKDSFPPHDNSHKLAEDFGKYFCRKIELIKDNIENSPASLRRGSL